MVQLMSVECISDDLLAECNGVSTVGKDRQEVLLLLRERPLVLKTIRTPG